MGEYFSLVDVYLIPTLELLPTLTYFRGVRINPTNSYNLIAYASRIRSFPSYFPVKVDITHVEMEMWRTLAEKAHPAILCMTILQHRSIICHLQSFIEFADELSRTNQGPKIIDPVKGSMGMQIKKFGKACGRLIELMHEHAQMEERMVFPPLEDADKGVTNTVNGYHARDLPVTNGIREDVKALMTIEKGTSDFKDTLAALILRLRSLQAYTTQHFQEEEQELLPLLAAAGLGNTQQEALVITCVDLMEATHGHHLPYFLLGLQPHEMHQYMLMMQKCSEGGQIFKRMMHTIQNADDEFENVRKEIGERMLSFASAWEIY
ncbi:hypothetical protein O6H91_14G002900 [Diphasiastrum complanatum]|uniref:Uncharacterized protein n=1 Tax=Diphasiastrum complanatum TaxID=34168 RepID=A0ACC2BLM6_DIPCM|nr:hypothetical protein O6H91_14G002900 [Diphasiastrum complanatum]